MAILTRTPRTRHQPKTLVRCTPAISTTLGGYLSLILYDLGADQAGTYRYSVQLSPEEVAKVAGSVPLGLLAERLSPEEQLEWMRLLKKVLGLGKSEKGA